MGRIVVGTAAIHEIHFSVTTKKRRRIDRRPCSELKVWRSCWSTFCRKESAFCCIGNRAPCIGECSRERCLCFSAQFKCTYFTVRDRAIGVRQLFNQSTCFSGYLWSALYATCLFVVSPEGKYNPIFCSFHLARRTQPAVVELHLSGTAEP